MNANQVIRLTAVYNAMSSRANPNETMYFTRDELAVLFDCGLILEIDKGGLLMAPSHDERGINLLTQEGDIFRFTAEFEGWEYIINPSSTKEFLDELKKINSYYDTAVGFEPYIVPRNIRIIEANPVPFFSMKVNRYLLNEGTIFVVNKYATKKDLQLINRINESML